MKGWFIMPSSFKIAFEYIKRPINVSYVREAYELDESGNYVMVPSANGNSYKKTQKGKFYQTIDTLPASDDSHKSKVIISHDTYDSEAKVLAVVEHLNSQVTDKQLMTNFFEFDASKKASVIQVFSKGSSNGWTPITE